MFTLTMESFAWFGALAAGFVVLHVVVVAYLYRRAVAGEESIGLENLLSGAESPLEEAAAEPQQAAGAETRVQCPTCGAPNDPSYRFCRRCVADLKSGGPAAGGPDGTERLGS